MWDFLKFINIKRICIKISQIIFLDDARTEERKFRFETSVIYDSKKWRGTYPCHHLFNLSYHDRTQKSTQKLVKHA